MFDNVDGHNANSQTNSHIDESHKTKSMVESIIPWRIWLKISSSLNDPWNQLRYIKWMNKQANDRSAYVPTEFITEKREKSNNNNGSQRTRHENRLQPQGIVLDSLCGEECNKGYSLLKPMGKYVLYGSANVVTGETKSFFSVARSWWQVDKVLPIKLFDENKSLMGFNLRHLLYQQGDFGATYVRGTIEKVFTLRNEGKIKPTVDTTWALEDVADAMQKMHDRKNIGKLILDSAQTPKPKPATPAKGKSKDKKQIIEDKSGDREKRPKVTPRLKKRKTKRKPKRMEPMETK